MTEILRNSTHLRFQLVGAAILFLLLASGCKRSPVGGLEVQPSDQLLGVVSSDAFEVVPYTVLEDSLQADETPINLLGSYYDPLFGYTESGIISQLRLSADNVDFGDGTLVADSVVLALQFDATYGNLDAQTFEVYEITDELFLDSTYYSNINIGYDATPIGRIESIAPNPTDSVTTADGTVPAQLQLHLNASFGQRLLEADPSVYTSNDAWIDYFKGFYIKPDNSNAGTGEGGIWYFALNVANSKMTLHFHQDGSSESQSYDFVVNDKSVRINKFVHNYTGSEVEPYLVNPGVAADRLYVQSMAGCKAKIEMPFLDALRDSSNIAIVKAELTVTGTEVNTIYLAHSNMVLRTFDGDQEILVPDFFEGSSHFDGIYNNNTYTLNITRYVQQYLNGTLNDNSLYLTGGSAFNNGNRTPLTGIANGASDLKVQISYTRL